MFENEQVETTDNNTTLNAAAFKYSSNMLNGDITSLCCDNVNKILYCGGTFTQTTFPYKKNKELNYICKMNTNGETHELMSLGTGFNSYVSCLTIDNMGNLYVGGNFTVVGGVVVNYIAKWNGDNWAPLAHGLSSMPNAMVIDKENNLIVGGTFLQADNLTVNYIAKWDGTRWMHIGSGFNASVSSLAVDNNGTIYAGGNFTRAGPRVASYLAQWNGAMCRWDSSIKWSGLGDLNAPVTCLAVNETGTLYVGGYFTNVGALSVNHICEWNGSNWKLLGCGLNSAPKCLITDGKGRLFVGGAFTNAGGCNANYISKWYNSKWKPLSAGLNSDVLSMAIQNTDLLFVSGNFNKVLLSSLIEQRVKLARWSENI